MPSLAVEAGQWGVTRHGVPRITAAAPPRGRDRTATGETRSAESYRRTCPAHTGCDQHASGAWAARRSAALAVRASAPHARGSAVQQPAGAVSLFRLRAASRRAPEVSGESPRTGDCVPGLVERAAASQAAGPLPGLER